MSFVVHKRHASDCSCHVREPNASVVMGFRKQPEFVFNDYYFISIIYSIFKIEKS